MDSRDERDNSSKTQKEKMASKSFMEKEASGKYRNMQAFISTLEGCQDDLSDAESPAAGGVKKKRKGKRDWFSEDSKNSPKKIKKFDDTDDENDKTEDDKTEDDKTAEMSAGSNVSTDTNTAFTHRETRRTLFVVVNGKGQGSRPRSPYY